jgi:hypothetical protein
LGNPRIITKNIIKIKHFPVLGNSDYSLKKHMYQNMWCL